MAFPPLGDELHQLPLFPRLLKFPLLFRLPAGKPLNPNAILREKATLPHRCEEFAADGRIEHALFCTPWPAEHSLPWP
jgi:hypothetical protein